MSDLTTNNFEDCKKYGGGYCIQCFEYDNPYYWPLDTLTCKEGSAMCANCLTEKIIPSNHFIGFSVKEIQKQLKKFSE